jgi:cytochrome c oxidase subunit 2
MRKRTMLSRWSQALALGLSGWVLAAGAAFAQVEGVPKPWGLNMQPAFSPTAARIHDFHNMLLVIITATVLLVLGILAYVMYRFSARRNPVPSKTTHNTLLEVIWTAVPILILVVIAIPSMRLLFYEESAGEADMTLKVVGRQWYWHYAYPDHGGFSFDSLPVQEADLQPGQPRLLAVDNPVVVPVGAIVRVETTADDVIHNWAVPSLGVKKDATPGRLNQTWFRADHEGVFYGQCSELCGVNHYFMPIQVVAVSREKFDAWVKEAQQKFAASGTAVTVAEKAPAVR